MIMDHYFVRPSQKPDFGFCSNNMMLFKDGAIIFLRRYGGEQIILDHATQNVQIKKATMSHVNSGCILLFLSKILYYEKDDSLLSSTYILISFIMF